MHGLEDLQIKQHVYVDKTEWHILFSRIVLSLNVHPHLVYNITVGHRPISVRFNRTATQCSICGRSFHPSIEWLSCEARLAKIKRARSTKV